MGNKVEVDWTGTPQDVYDELTVTSEGETTIIAVKDAYMALTKDNGRAVLLAPTGFDGGKPTSFKFVEVIEPEQWQAARFRRSLDNDSETPDE